jgi:3-hydroxy-3-methylglutaryl CoA synthase
VTGFSATLDIAKPGDRILMVSFGSGAGSDAFVWEVTEALKERRHKARWLRITSPGESKLIMGYTSAIAASCW